MASIMAEIMAGGCSVVSVSLVVVVIVVVIIIIVVVVYLSIA
jgi:hypothetical protein